MKRKKNFTRNSYEKPQRKGTENRLHVIKLVDESQTKYSHNQRDNLNPQDDFNGLLGCDCAQ